MLGQMAVNPHAEHVQELLEDLNEPQREAVTHGDIIGRFETERT